MEAWLQLFSTTALRLCNGFTVRINRLTVKWRPFAFLSIYPFAQKMLFINSIKRLIRVKL